MCGTPSKIISTFDPIGTAAVGMYFGASQGGGGGDALAGPSAQAPAAAPAAQPAQAAAPAGGTTNSAARSAASTMLTGGAGLDQTKLPLGSNSLLGG